jgi:tRNA (guanine37-N1)-methyltransferase
MRIHVLTLFPGLFDGFLDETIVRIAQDKGALEVDLVDFREFATDRHRKVDDRPFGGGPGMILMADPIIRAAEDLERRFGPMHRVMLTPAGTPLDQAMVERLAKLPELLLLCGRYEGFDERVRLALEWEEVSIGDFVLSGGEVPAMVVIDAVARLQPGVLGDEESARADSFSSGRLDHPQYTRPRAYRGLEVPEVLLGGDHAAIAAWRLEQAIERTRQRERELAAGPAANDGQVRDASPPGEDQN